MKRAAFYVRVSTVDQNPQTQLRELREYAQRRGLTVVQEHEYVHHGGDRAQHGWCFWRGV